MRKPYKTEASEALGTGKPISWTWHFPGIGRLTMWDVTHLTGERMSRNRKTGHSTLAYTFRQSRKRTALFSGEDFGCPRHMPIDSLECAISLLNFLCLRYGDTDREYFEKYTEEQRAWCESSACEAAQAALAEIEEALRNEEGNNR